jgi:diguanylate cyclase
MDEKQQRKGLEVMDRNLRAQIRLIDDLLSISHIIAGKIRLDLREVDALQVVRTAVDSVRPSVREKGLNLRFSVGSGITSIPAVLDPARLQQIVWNLLSNAVKFTRQGGRITVTIEQSGNTLVLQVSDTGEGIAPDFLPHVFERFRQADYSPARKYGGLGIGLSVVRQLVDLHGGVVRVQSEGRGKGATFTVSLPLGLSSSSAQWRPPQPA